MNTEQLEKMGLTEKTKNNMNKPTCSEETALRQAGMTIRGYMREEIEMIEDQLGKGYAKNNPGLIGDLVKAQTMDFNCTANSAALYEIAQAVEGNSNFELAHAIKKLSTDSIKAKLDIYEDQKASSNPIADAICNLSEQIKYSKL